MIINLISSPRNVSTALMYSFAQRPDMRVMDEPFYAYYLWRSEADHPGRAEILESQPRHLPDVLEWINESKTDTRASLRRTTPSPTQT